MRCGTSIGANAEEAQDGQTKPDYIAKMSVSRKESRETLYWLRLAIRINLVTKPEIAWELQEAGDGAVALAASEQCHACRVLATIAEEEASKVLILLDAVRCPRLPSDRLSNQVGRFNDHFAKGLYARSCWYRPTTLGQLQEYINHDRDQFYLDGPNDVDWIFRNEIIQARRVKADSTSITLREMTVTVGPIRRSLRISCMPRRSQVPSRWRALSTT